MITHDPDTDPSARSSRGARERATDVLRPWGPSTRLVVAGLLIAYSLVMATVPRFPYIKVQPGSATDVLDLISIEGTPQYSAEGDLLFLTVQLSQRLSPAEAVLAWLDDEVELRREDVFTGGRPREEITRLNLAVMNESKLVAIKVALEHLGYPIDVIGGGSMVTDVLPDRPASDILEPGDVIVAVDGVATTFTKDVVEAVQNREPGSSVRLTIDRLGEETTVEVGTVRGPDGVAQIGVQLNDNLEFDFPFEVDINTGRVGGPSAGLAFTLAVLDDLTEGELTGGKRVAVTGAIDVDGDVLPVGGVELKTIAARRAGAVLMLVPEGEAELADPFAGDMQVVAVRDLGDALAALDGIGGNALALPRTGGAPAEPAES